MISNYNINNYVDKIFYINLDKDVDRNNNMIEQLKKHNINNYERFSGILIDDISKYKYNLMGPFHGVKDVERYKRGSIGCLLSHKGVIELSKQRKYKKILILEDDITFHQNFNEMFDKYMKIFEESKKYWNLLYLGLDDWKNNKTNQKINEDIYRIVAGGYGSHSYILHYNIFDYILQNIDYAKIEIDLLYNSMNIKRAIHTYIFTENLIYKEDKFDSNIRKYD